MTELETFLARVAKRLDSLGTHWAVIGGIAVSSRSEPRFTRDIDIAVSVQSDDEAEKITLDFRQSGMGILAMIEQEAKERLATVRLNVDANSEVITDLMFSSSGIEPEIVKAAKVIKVFTNTYAPVAQIGHLIALKVLSKNEETRPQDLTDLRHLLLVANEVERSRAREAVKLITERGYNRDKDLTGELERLCHLYLFTG
jgi:predicted nucleotidyltransferase